MRKDRGAIYFFDTRLGGAIMRKTQKKVVKKF